MWTGSKKDVDMIELEGCGQATQEVITGALLFTQNKMDNH